MNVHELALAGLNDHRLFTTLDLAGTFAFAISGAAAARDRGLDWFGVAVIAFTVAALMTIAANGLVVRLAHPVILFDSIGLGLFAVTGAQKAMILGHNAEVAVLLGVVTAVGGGLARDVLLNRVPVILQREIYASAALVGAGIEVLGERLGWLSSSRTWVALVVCFTLRYLSLRYKWNLPHSSRRDDRGTDQVQH